jgi:deoxycytidylate deaminase
MTCAKAQVSCTIISANGVEYTGTNACRNPQEVCPRAPGEDYAKCSSICDQIGHAEIVALNLAGHAARGGKAIVRGNTYACRPCQEALYAAGIEWISVRG